jgi:hypothetical protein
VSERIAARHQSSQRSIMPPSSAGSSAAGAKKCVASPLPCTYLRVGDDLLGEDTLCMESRKDVLCMAMIAHTHTHTHTHMPGPFDVCVVLRRQCAGGRFGREHPATGVPPRLNSAPPPLLQNLLVCNRRGLTAET